MSARRMTVLQHMEELRKRILRASIVALVLIIVSLVYYKQILAGFTAPVQDLLSDAGSEGLIAIKLTETWSVATRLAVLLGLMAALPFYMLEVALYLKPALKAGERKYIYIMPPATTLLFAAGGAFAYYVLAPFFFRFLINISSGISGTEVRPTIETTVGLLISFVFWMGIVFEIPIVMFLLAKAGILTSKALAGKRRWVILIAFILGAAITPTVDPLTQAVTAAPVIVLFEVGYLLTKLVERSRARDEMRAAHGV